MTQARKKWLTFVITLAVIGVIGTVAVVYALDKLQGDAEVLNDIDRHFAAASREAPLNAPSDVGIAGVSTPSPAPETPGAGSGQAGSEKASEKAPGKARPGKRARSRRRRRAEAATPAADPGWPRIRRIGPAVFEIDTALAEAARARPQQFIPGVQAIIAEINGAPAGFRLLGISPGSALFALGLRNGDVLTAVNGFALKSVDEALLAAGSAKFAEKFRVDILRRGRPQSLYYRIASFLSGTPS